MTDQQRSELKSTLSLQVIQFTRKISNVLTLLLYYLSEATAEDIGRLRPTFDKSTKIYENSGEPVVGADAIKQKDSTKSTGQKIFQFNKI